MNWTLLGNSLWVSALATVLAAGFGVASALWAAGLERRLRTILFAIAIVALALPPFLVTNCWLDLLGFTGVWNSWLPFKIMSLGGAVWILALLTWPITMLLVFGAWQQLEPAQLEADSMVAGWFLIRGLLLPLAGRALGLAAMLTFVLALNNFAVPVILQVRVFPEELWVRFTTTFDSFAALRLSVPLVIAPLLLLVFFGRRTVPWPRIDGAVAARIFRRQLGSRWWWACGVVTLALCALSVGLPVFQIVSAKRTWTELSGALAAGKPAVWNSLWYSGGAATIIIAAGLLLGVWGAYSRRDQRRAGFHPAPPWKKSLILRSLALITWLPFLVPGVLLGIALIAIFNRPVLAAFYHSAGIVILAFAIRYFAIGRGAVGQSINGTDRDLADVARLDGATRWQMLRHVYWPQISAQVMAAWYIVFLLCLWDVESMILIVPPGGETLAVRIFNLLHYGHNAQVNALCLALMVLAVAPLLIWAASRAIRGATFARTAIMAGMLAFVGSISTGCGPQTTGNEAPAQSKLFSRVEIIGARRGRGVGEFIKPRTLAVDRQDNVYVCDMSARIQKFSPDGTFLLSWQLPVTDLGKPKGMTRDLDGNIIVVEPHYSRVNVFTTNGVLLSQWGEYGTNAGQLKFPRSIALDSKREMFISEYGVVERVQKFLYDAAPGSLPGATNNPRANPPRFISMFGEPGNGPGQFNRAEGVFVDKNDILYVADSCNHRIQIFTTDGKFLRSYGKAGNGPGEMSYPYDICVDAEGNQFVCEFGNSRIQVFDAHDHLIEILGGPGAGPGYFNNPWSIALDSHGNLYVADALNDRVQKFIRRTDVASANSSFSSSSSIPFSNSPSPD